MAPGQRAQNDLWSHAFHPNAPPDHYIAEANSRQLKNAFRQNHCHSAIIMRSSDVVAHKSRMDLPVAREGCYNMAPMHLFGG